MSELLRLTDEQTRILNEIRDKIKEFHDAGGFIYAVDYDSNIFAVNASNVENVELFYEDVEDTYIEDGYVEVNGARQYAPFYIPIVSEYFDLCVKPKHVFHNLF